MRSNPGSHQTFFKTLSLMSVYVYVEHEVTEVCHVCALWLNWTLNLLDHVIQRAVIGMFETINKMFQRTVTWTLVSEWCMQLSSVSQQFKHAHVPVTSCLYPRAQRGQTTDGTPIFISIVSSSPLTHASVHTSQEHGPPRLYFTFCVLCFQGEKMNVEALSRAELLTLLSIMEGELEAQDVVIHAVRVSLGARSRHPRRISVDVGMKLISVSPGLLFQPRTKNMTSFGISGT